MEFLKILLFCIAAAIFYGIVHDQITARICVEYFTIGHPTIIETNDPTLLGLIWGVLATWWGGLFLGYVIASVSRLGDWPKRSMRSLIRPISILLFLMAIGAVISGVIGHAGASNSSLGIPRQWVDRVPVERHVAFVTALWAHNASYLVAFLGGMTLAVQILRGRKRAARMSDNPS